MRNYDPRAERPAEERTPMGYGITFALAFSFSLVCAYALFQVFWYPSLYQEAVEGFEEKYEWEIAASKALNLPPPSVQERWCEAQGHCGPARVGLMDSLLECQEELKVKFPDLLRVAKKIGCEEIDKRIISDYRAINEDIEGFYDDIDLYSKNARALCAEELYELEREVNNLDYAVRTLFDESRADDLMIDYYQAHCPKVALKSFKEMKWWWEKDMIADE